MSADLYAIALCISVVSLVYVSCELLEWCKKLDEELEDVS